LAGKDRHAAVIAGSDKLQLAEVKITPVRRHAADGLQRLSAAITPGQNRRLAQNANLRQPRHFEYNSCSIG
jgi:hypothetical protein